MEFVKEFATFLYEVGALKFGDFALASGKKSSYYVDLRIVPSFPHEFRKMIKYLQNKITQEIELDEFDSLVSVPTGGLVIASALAIETIKPLIYVRTKSKEYGTSKLVEGKVRQGMKALMIDDVATSGGSILRSIETLKKEGVVVKDAYVIVNRLEGATKNLAREDVTMHQITDIIEITNALYENKLVSNDVLEKVKNQISPA